MKFRKVAKSLLKFSTALIAVGVAACGNVELQDGALQDDALQTSQNSTVDASISIQNVATCSMTPVADGFGIVCDGSLVGTLKNGTDGKDGSGCSLAELEGGLGYQVFCGETMGVILNGTDGRDGVDGIDGADGEDCTIAKASDGSGVFVMCGDRSLLIRHGSNGIDGKDGVSCSAAEVDEGFSLYCGEEYIGVIRHGTDGSSGKNGKDGTSCHAEEYEDGDVTGFSIYCGDVLVGNIYNGISTKDTVVVKDTLVISKLDTLVLNHKDTLVVSKKDTTVLNHVDTLLVKDTVVIDGCGIVAATDTSVFVACGKDTSEVRAKVNITYNNGNQTTSFEPIIVYVSSSSVTSSSSSIEVVVNSSSINYVVELGAVEGKCSAVKSPIYRGDTSAWKMNTSKGSIDDIMNSIYSWDLPGSNVETYVAKGNQGLIPNIRYESVGTYEASVSINGSDMMPCSGSIVVKPSLIRECSCDADETYESEDSVKWVLSGCKSYATITKYTWEGVGKTSDDGLIAYTPKDFEGPTKVNLLNEDGSEKDVACGYKITNGTLIKLDKPGKYYVGFGCSSYYANFILTSETGSAMWITNKSSGIVDRTTHPYFNELFDVTTKDDALGSMFIFVLTSGTFSLGCT